MIVNTKNLDKIVDIIEHVFKSNNLGHTDIRAVLSELTYKRDMLQNMSIVKMAYDEGIIQ